MHGDVGWLKQQKIFTKRHILFVKGNRGYVLGPAPNVKEIVSSKHIVSNGAKTSFTEYFWYFLTNNDS